MRVRYKLTGTEADASCFNVHAIAEVLTGDDSAYISDLDVYVDGAWKDMRQAFADGDIIPDNYNTFFGVPRNDEDRARGYFL
jgi:hypothetical protein